MFFTRTVKYNLTTSKDSFIEAVVGKHVKIHNMDFEVIQEDSNTLVIIPHMEQVNAIKTLPITTISIKSDKVTITSEMRKVDAGGPQLVVAFCAFLSIASLILFFQSSSIDLAYIFAGISVFLFSIFWIRMQMGYFDYIHKVQAYVKSKIVAQSFAASDIGLKRLA